MNESRLKHDLSICQIQWPLEISEVSISYATDQTGQIILFGHRDDIRAIVEKTKQIPVTELTESPLENVTLEFGKSIVKGPDKNLFVVRGWEHISRQLKVSEVMDARIRLIGYYSEKLFT